MGSNDHLPDLEASAIEAASKAGAFEECPVHRGELYSVGDPDAEKKAYAIGTNMHKNGDIDATLPEFRDAIKDVLEQMPEHCPECDRAMYHAGKDD